MTGLREKLDLANHQLISMFNISTQVYQKVQIAAAGVGQKILKLCKNMNTYVVLYSHRSVVSSNLSLIYTGSSNVGHILNDHIAICAGHIYAQINMTVKDLAKGQGMVYIVKNLAFAYLLGSNLCHT